jgi:hypothetical protein
LISNCIGAPLQVPPLCQSERSLRFKGSAHSTVLSPSSTSLSLLWDEGPSPDASAMPSANERRRRSARSFAYFVNTEPEQAVKKDF